MSATKDDVLVMRAKKEDQDAFCTLFLRYREDIYRSLVQVVHNDEVVKDLLHDTYVKAWRHIASLNEPSSCKSWLIVIARNLAIDWLRQNPPRRTILLEGNGSAFNLIDENADSQIVVEKEYVRSVLAQIEPPVLRNVLILHTFGYSRAEIAHLLGYAEGTITTYLSQARKQFWQLYKMMDQTE